GYVHNLATLCVFVNQINSFIQNFDWLKNKRALHHYEFVRQEDSIRLKRQ
ncbi:MAG: hypothetical protein ACI9NY_000738, partial [Kiritimatiellia bacterium]